MTSARPSRTPIDRAESDSIVEAVRALLSPHYRAAASPRFPFGMHHACVRSRTREPLTRRYLRQAEIAALLTEWAIQNGGAEAYAWQSIALAMEELTIERKTRAANEVMRQAESIVENLPPFIPWMKNRLLAAIQPQP